LHTTLPEAAELDNRANDTAHATAPGPASPETHKGGAGEVSRGPWHRLHLGALVAHLFLSLFFTWPLALNFLPGAGTTVPGYLLVDRDQNLWNLWWVRQSVLGWHNPFVTDMIWYPTPVSLYYHTLNVFNGLLAIPLLQIFSLTTVYNIVVLFSFVLGGYGAFLLVRYVCGNRWAALTGSVVFAYSAYHIATMRGLLQLISLEWVPFFLLLLLLAVNRPAWRSASAIPGWLFRWALPAGFALLLVSLVDWYYTMYALILAGFLGLYALFQGLRSWRIQAQNRDVWRVGGEPLVRLALCIGVYALLVSPILVPMLAELRGTNYMQPAADSALRYSADLLKFFQTPRFQQLWSSNFRNWLKWPFADNAYEVYCSYAALFLAGVGLFAVKHARPAARVTGIGPSPIVHRPSSVSNPETNGLRPGKWFWASCVVVFFLLALGPVLQVDGHQVRTLGSTGLVVPMPYGLAEHVPLLNISRSPDRFDMPLTLCLGILAGYGVNVLMNTWLQGLSFDRRGLLIAGAALALVTIELAPMPFPQLPAGIPRWYDSLSQEQGDFSILELPPQDDFWHGAFRMYFQTAHGKHIFGGYLSREFSHPFLLSTTGYQELSYADGHGDMFQAGPDQWLSAMAMYKTRYVVLQKVRYPGSPAQLPDITSSRDAVKKVLGGGVAPVPVYADSELEVYRVAQPASRVPFASVGDGWEPRERNPQGESYRWMHASGTLRIDSPAPMTANLVFNAESLGSPRRIRIWYGDHIAYEGTIPAARQSFHIGPLELSAGVSSLRIDSLDGTTSPAKLGLGNDPRELSIVLLDVSLEPAK
jgi:hypothetical protein